MSWQFNYSLRPTVGAGDAHATPPEPVLDPAATRQLQAAAEALAAGDTARAERHLSRLTRTYPTHPRVLFLEAGVYSQRGRRREALLAMQRALALRPDDAVYHSTMAGLLGEAGDYDRAIAELHRACELQPRLVLAWYNLGVMFTRCGRHADAVAAFRRTLELEAGHADARIQLADALHHEGRVAEAAAEYRRVLGRQPWAGVAWWGLANLKPARCTPADVTAMQAAIGAPRASVDDKVATGFALAKVLEDAGRYEAALAALAQAKAWRQQRRRWDAASFSRGIASVRAAFTRPPAGARASGLGSEVIFIVGLPRSGSTLVEQILASHPQVSGAGELPDARAVIMEESQRRNQSFPAWVRDVEPSDWERMGRRYLERTRKWHRTRPVFTDKMPGNWKYVGAIMAMLPEAHVVCCRRDPLESCFSCYRFYRAQGSYTNTFEDVATFWQAYDDSVRLWCREYPENVYAHSYEALLGDPGSATRRLLEFCGLPWDARCLRFYDNTRAVQSPSASQVREPLRRDTARGPRYGSLLDPLRAALGMAPFADVGREAGGQTETGGH